MKIIKLLLIFVLLLGDIVLLLNWNAVFKSGSKAERKKWEALMEQVGRLEQQKAELEEENGSLKNQLKAKDNEEVAAAEAKRLEAERREAEKKATEKAQKKGAEADKEKAYANARKVILDRVNANATIAEIRKSDAWKLLTEKEQITVEVVSMDPKERYRPDKCTADNITQLQKEVQKILNSKKPYSSFEDMEKTQIEIGIIETNYHYAKK